MKKKDGKCVDKKLNSQDEPYWMSVGYTAQEWEMRRKGFEHLYNDNFTYSTYINDLEDLLI
jgi:hypothetical protein